MPTRFVVRAVLIDAGFTLSVYNGARLAVAAAEHGVDVEPVAIQAAEESLRREMSAASWAFSPSGAGARKGEALYRRLLQMAGATAPAHMLDRASEAIWGVHIKRNFWDKILPGVPEALRDLRDAGLKLVVVSNSEGNVEAMLVEQGLRDFFDVVLDSTVVGVAKPDPRIFALALDSVGIEDRQHAVMVGDSVKADVEGALAAGIHAALLDPFDLFPDAPAPRFPDFPAFARSVVRHVG